MRAIDSKEKTIAVFKVLETALNSFVPLGKRKWVIHQDISMNRKFIKLSMLVKV